MADRSVAFLIIARDFASRTMKNVGDSTDRTAQKLRDLSELGIKPVATAAATLGPALVPVLAGAAVGAVGLGTALVGAGAGMAVFGAVTKSVFSEVLAASQKSEDLRAKIGLLARSRDLASAAGDSGNAEKYEKARVRAIYEYRARLAELPPAMRAAVIGMDGMRTSWEGFVAKNRAPVLQLLAVGSLSLASALPKLQPLFNVTARAASGLLTTVGRFISGGGLDRTVAFLAARAGPAFTHFGSIILNLGRGFGSLLAPWAATSDGMIGSLDRLSARFATWAAGSGAAGMERILGFIREEGPGAVSALGELAGAVGVLAQAALPLAPVSAAIAGALGSIVTALPQPVLTGLIGSFIAWNVAVTGARVATLLMGGASRIASVGVWLMSTALLSSPITWVVLGLVALAAGLYVAYQRSETFRAIVQGALSGVVGAGRAVLAFFQGVPGFFSGVWSTITGAFTTATTWIGGRLTALGGWFSALPGRVMRGVMALPGLWWGFWTGLLNRAAFLVGYGIGLSIRIVTQAPGKIMAGIRSLGPLLASFLSATWNRAYARTVAGVNGVVSFVGSLPGKAGRAVSSLWGRMSGAYETARSRAITLAGQAVTGAVGWFQRLPGRAASALSGLPGRIKGVFSGAATWLVSAGRDVIMGLVNGIGNAAGAAVQKARDIAGSIVSGVKAGFGVNSPSTVMRDEVGRWLPPGIMNGVEAATPSMLGRMAAVMGRLTGAATRPIVGNALLTAEAAYTGAGRPAMAPSTASIGEVLQPVQLVVDGKVLQEVLLRIKRNSGGVSLGLA